MVVFLHTVDRKGLHLSIQVSGNHKGLHVGIMSGDHKGLHVGIQVAIKGYILAGRLMIAADHSGGERMRHG